MNRKKAPPAEKRIGLTELRKKLYAVLDDITDNGAVYIVTKRGEPVGVMVPADWIGAEPESKRKR